MTHTQGEKADTIPEDHNYTLAPDPAAVDLPLDENVYLRKEILQLGNQNEKLTIKQQIAIHCFAGPDRDI